jgi:hypothetical protein
MLGWYWRVSGYYEALIKLWDVGSNWLCAKPEDAKFF